MKAVSILLAVMVYGLASHADPRLWGEQGLPVRQGTHMQWEQAAAQDAAGNTLAVWADARTGTLGIYAQLIGPQGNILWPDSGIAVALDDVPRWNPAVCAVDGGWVIAWLDYLNNPDNPGAWELEIWAQKIDNSGNRLWAGGELQGMPVDTSAARTQLGSLHVVDDGGGGALIAWIGWRNSSNVFAQRVSAAGQTLWPAPLAVTNIPGHKYGLSAAADGEHNLLLTWVDYRNNPTAPDLFAAKVTTAGETPWGTNGVAVSTAPGTQDRAQIRADGAGGAYVIWNSQLRPVIQRLNAAGLPLWASGGILIHSFESYRSAPQIAASRAGGTPDGCFVVWTDNRANLNSDEVFCQKFGPAGVPLWAENGVLICGGSGPGDTYDRSDPRVVSDEAGGLVCTWEEHSNAAGGQNSIRGKRLAAQGETVWGGECGVRLTDLPGDGRAALMNGADRCTIIFQSGRYYGGGDLLAQQLSLGGGARLLGDNGSRLLDNLDGGPGNAAVVALSDGRAAVAWRDWRLDNFPLIHFQIISRDGEMTAVSNGEPLVTDYEGYAILDQSRPQLCANGTGGFFCVFEDQRTGTKRIRLSRVNAAGEVVGSPAGTVVWDDAAASDQIEPYCVADGQGGCYVAWSQFSDVYIVDAYVMRMTAGGQPAWALPVRLTDSPDDNIITGIVGDESGGCIVVWQMGTFGDINIAAARIAPNGLLWNTMVCEAAGDQENPVLLAGGQGGAYIAWTDRRSGNNRRGIYAQRLSAAGGALWSVNGIAVATDALYQINPQLAAAPGGVYVVWEDFRNGQNTDIYAQRLTAAGDRLWPEGGLPLCVAERDQGEPRAWSDNYGNLFAVWSDRREYIVQKVYGISVWPNGDPVESWWVPQMGGPISTAGNQNHYPKLAGFGSHFCYVVWQQEYNFDEEWEYCGLWAQLVETAGLGIGDDPQAELPVEFALAQNYPNPFNPLTRIEFALPHATRAKLTVYNLLGQEVARLLDAPLPAGVHAATFDARAVSSGVFFYRLEAGAFAQTRKMVLLK